MKRVLAGTLLAAVAVSGAQAAHAGDRLLRFDTGHIDSSMVVGLFLDNGRMYHPRADFEFPRLDGIRNLAVIVGLHVGSKAAPAPGQTELKAGVRVNGHAWQWQDLGALRDDQLHWVEFPVPLDHWRAGVNRVEVTSTVGSPGNMNARTVDIPCSFNTPAKVRSYFSHDLRGWLPQRDRHWFIRVRYEVAGPGAEAKTLRIVGAPTRVKSTGEARFVAVVEDADGLLYTPEEVEWSADAGAMVAPGVFRPDGPGAVTVSARADGMEASAEIAVADSSWTGVVPADSDQRLGAQVPEGHVSLCGAWDFRMDPEDRGLADEWFRNDAGLEWIEIHVPGCWQGQATPLSYHGIGWYRRSFEVPADWRDRELWLRFGGAATEARVWVNGRFAGEHLGNWTPFTLRITDLVEPAGKNTVVVRVKEMPDHFSAGFPRILGLGGGVDNHFGGLWQEVSMASTGPLRIDDVYVAPSLAEKTVRVEVQTAAVSDETGTVSCVLVDPEGTEVVREERPLADGCAAFAFAVDDPRPWSPETPVLYQARVEVSAGDEASDTHTVRFGLRDAVRQGSQILLNGKPIFIRGVLHWGYYPHLFSIDPSEESIRREFEELRAAGFNLVKVCLFVFPERFYEIADETGMLVWQEYPLWQTVPAKGDTDRHDLYRSEYREWIRFDRNHPSVIVRDLTCEANPAVVDMAFLGEIYDMTKAMTHGALLEDNSGFFTHEKTDFYDAHFYRDLDEMYDLLPALADHIRSRPEVKPYLSGEDMDADTYRNMEAIRKRFSRDGSLPWWLDNAHFRNQEGFETWLTDEAGPDAPARLVEAQLRHAIAFRKLLFEEFRRHPELSGYCMTSIRDNPLTRPGFFDDLERPKWPAEAWHRFNGDYELTLESPVRSRCYPVDDRAEIEMILSNYGRDLASTPVRWRLRAGDRVVEEGAFAATSAAGEIVSLGRISLDWQDLAPRDAPAIFRLEAVLGEDPVLTRNDWRLWTFPNPQPKAAVVSAAWAYSPDGSDRLVDWLPGFGLVAVEPDGDGWRNKTGESIPALDAPGTVLLTDALDAPVLNALEQGARVVYVTRDTPQPLNYAFMSIPPRSDHEGASGADDLPRVDAPFWREMAVWLPEGRGVLGDFPHEGYVDLPFLDLTQRRPFALGDIRDAATPWVWGVNARFNDPFPVVDYVFEARAGRGRLLACSLNVFGEHNTAGRYLLGRLLEYQAESPSASRPDPEKDILPFLTGEH